MENGLLFVEDVKGGEPPDPVTDDVVQFTASCISVACLHEMDGEAEFLLGPADEVAPAYDLAFDGNLETPSRELILSAVTGEPFLKAKVPDVLPVSASGAAIPAGRRQWPSVGDKRCLGAGSF